MHLRWESQRGDDWWCGDAFASLENGTLNITDFGDGCTPVRAIALIRAATDQFDGPPWVFFSDKTSVADDLLDSGAVTSVESLGPHRIRLVITPQRTVRTTWFLRQACGTPSLFGDAGWYWYNFRSSDIVRFVQGGVVKTFRWQTHVKSNDVYKPIREGLKPALKPLGFSRVKSSPPSYSRAGGFGCLCLWFKVRSAGWDSAFGGKLTGAIQSAPAPHPGIEWVSGEFASKRLWSLLDDSARRSAVNVHNSILAKFSTPNRDHWIYTMQPDIVESTLADLEPLTQIPPADHDFWFRYLDADDVAKWAAFFAKSLPQMADGFESSLA